MTVVIRRFVSEQQLLQLNKAKDFRDSEGRVAGVGTLVGDASPRLQKRLRYGNGVLLGGFEQGGIRTIFKSIRVGVVGQQ